MKAKETKKFGLDLFQKVDFKPGNAKSDVLVFLCAAVFAFFYFSSVIFLDAYGQRERRGVSSEKSQMQISKNVLAAENQKKESMAEIEGNISPEEKKISEVMSEAASSVKNLATRKARAVAAAKKLAAEKALRRSAPILSGSTRKLPDGRRVCTGNSDHPQRGGATHMDEDCCADYNETPNPRCYYSPEKMKIMK